MPSAGSTFVSIQHDVPQAVLDTRAVPSGFFTVMYAYDDEPNVPAENWKARRWPVVPVKVAVAFCPGTVVARVSGVPAASGAAGSAGRS